MFGANVFRFKSIYFEFLRSRNAKQNCKDMGNANASSSDATALASPGFIIHSPLIVIFIHPYFGWDPPFLNVAMTAWCHGLELSEMDIPQPGVPAAQPWQAQRGSRCLKRLTHSWLMWTYPFVAGWDVWLVLRGPETSVTVSRKVIFFFAFPLVFLFPEWNRVDQSSTANTSWQWKGGLSLSNVSEFSRPLKYQTKPATKYCKRNVCFHPLQRKNNNMLWLLYRCQKPPHKYR